MTTNMLTSKTMNLLTLGALMLALPACKDADKDAYDLVVFGDDLPESTDAAAGTVIETLTDADGATLTFIDMGDGDVGVLEHRPANRPSRLLPLQADEPTPLEIYMAVKGADTLALARLQQHHAQTGKGSPREFSIAPKPSQAAPNLDEEGYHDLDTYCNLLDWDGQWGGDLGPLSTYDATDFYVQEDLAAPLYFAPGTTANTKTWIGACVADHKHGVYDDKRLTIQRLTDGTWTNVSGESWYLDASSYNNVYTFYAYSVAGARYRGKLWVEVGGCETTGCSDTEPSFGWGLAWTPVPGLGS